MARLRTMHVRIAILTVLLAVASIAQPMTAAAASDPPGESYYLAVGDSLAWGYPTGVGYADYLYETLRASDPSLQLVNLGCPGESTKSMLYGPPAQPECTAAYADFGGAETQMEAAKWFLKKHRGAATHLTIDVGANDVLGCVNAAATPALDPVCVQRGTADVARNLPIILDRLRGVTTWRTKAAGMTYYDPYLATWTTNRDLALQSLLLTNGLNILEATNYLRGGFRVAPVSFAFRTNDFSQGVQLPVNVEMVCRYTLMCPLSSASNIHPNADGYRLIAQTFAKTFGVG